MAWTLLDITRHKPHLKRKLLVTIVFVCVLNFSVEFVTAVGFLNQYSAQRAVADYLRDHFDPKANTRIFCDEGTVTVMSGIPAEKFLTSSDAPKDREAFSGFLKEKNVEYLVFVVNQDSTLNRLLPFLEYGDDYGSFKPEMNSRTPFLPTNIWIYRVLAAPD